MSAALRSKDRTLDLLPVLAHATRLEICRRLATDELCVCHLASDLGLSQPLVSHHVKVLNEAGLLASRRHSYWTYYRLRPEPLLEMAGHLGALAQRARIRGIPRPCC